MERIGIAMRRAPLPALPPVDRSHSQRPILSGQPAHFDMSMLDHGQYDHVDARIGLNDLLF